MLKGFHNIWKVSAGLAYTSGFVIAIIVYLLSRRSIRKAIVTMPDNREGVNGLFKLPLIFAAGLLSFAHGANDVANAIGPLAAITETLSSGAIAGKASIPLWVMAIGAFGLALGLALYGPKLIRTVGGEITELDKSRAYCIALSAAFTVIIASQLGLPVSSTHTALGGVFGVGFLQEYLKTRYASKLHNILEHYEEKEQTQVRAFLDDFNNADVEDMRAMLTRAKHFPQEIPLTKKDRKQLKKIYRHELVKRHHLYRIVAAWIITVPVSAGLGAMMFYMLRGMLL